MYKLWPGQARLWPFWPLFNPYDLDLQPTWKNVSNGTSPPRGQQVCKIILKSMHKCTSYGPDKLNIWPFWSLFDPCDLDLQPTWKNVSNGTSPPRGQQACKIILKSMHKCTSYGPDKLNIWPFGPLFDPCDLDPQPTWKNISNGTFPSRGQQLCKIILKSMHKCTSYGPDKLNIWPFFSFLLTFIVTLTFNLPEKMFQMALLLLKGNNCAKSFWNPCINIQVMLRTSSVYDHFDRYLTPVTLTFNLSKEMFQMALLLLRATTVPNCFEIHELLYKLWCRQIRTDARMHTELKL